MTSKRRSRKRGFGRLRRLPSKRWQAAYTGPDMAVHNAPSTFDTAEDAEAWLAAERRLIAADEWEPPKARVARKRAPRLNLDGYATTWLAERDIKPRTRDHYRDLLDRLILSDLGDLPVTAITPETVRAWHASLPAERPVQRAHAYSLLRSIMRTAVGDRIVDRNPCMIPGAGSSKRSRKITLISLDDLAAITNAMPPRLQAMCLLAAWCGLRFGELAELRRGDIAISRDDDGIPVAGVVHVRRGVVRVDNQTIIGSPKSDAGIRDVVIPPHLVPVVVSHLAEHVARGRDALLFPSSTDPTEHLHPTTLGKHWRRAREAAGYDALRFHDLRHLGATLAASTGATLRELMSRLGHSTTHAALLYQHVAQGRDAEIAAALSDMATASNNVVPITKRTATERRETS